MTIYTHLRQVFLTAATITAGIIMTSCATDDLEDPSLREVDDILTLEMSEDSLLLDEKFFDMEVVFNWSTGTNEGTGAAIEYTVEVDATEGDFSAPIISLVQGEKNRFSASLDHGNLNNTLLQAGFAPGEFYKLKARVTAVVSDTTVADQVDTLGFTVKPYKPVSQSLFILGDATPNGWDIGNAAQLTPGSERGVFIYTGKLYPGNFKFAVNQESCFCQDFYTRDGGDPGRIIYNQGGSGEDLQWTITQEDNYEVRVDLLNKTINIKTVEGAPFSELFIVGSATESQWTVDNPAAFTQSDSDPFVFTYEGNFAPGEFKIFAGPMGDWCGEWYRPLVDDQPVSDGEVVQMRGCDPDNTWLVTTETAGRYRISLHTGDNSIRFEKINLYMIGDAGPNGWDISTPTAMGYENGDFVFQGELLEGEFKFSKFQGGWCDGGWINAATAGQSITDTSFITTSGCDGPDNKWTVTTAEAGNYEIRINLDTENMTITSL